MRWILLICVVFLIAPLFVYYHYFGSSYLSKNFKDWIDFSQYYMPFITIFNGALLVFLTWKIHKENIALNKPILIFTIKDESPPHGIKNIGSGPAINIEIYTSTKIDKWDRKIKGLTLGKGETCLLNIPAQGQLGAIYYDQAGHQEKCYMIHTSMSFKNIDSKFSQHVEEEIFIWEI